ncbi:MAG: hypothetical protein AB7E61_07115 [Acholeplasmataceae bacterium]
MIRFIEETHQYFVDDVEVPSVSVILGSTIFANKYANVDELTLQNAALFGKGVHKAIETGHTFMLDDIQMDVYRKYLFLIKRKNIKPIKHEIIVHLDTLYAGTFDMEATVNEFECLCDAKTTYELDFEYLSWQLSLYELANGRLYDKLYAIWLPKRKGAELREIERKTQTEIEMLLTLYYKKKINLDQYYKNLKRRNT